MVGARAKPGNHSITCRSRKVKCDETRPSCNNCRKARLSCVPCEPVSFRHWHNPSVDNGRKQGPFKADHVWVSIDPDYKFIDESHVIASEYQLWGPIGKTEDVRSASTSRIQQALDLEVRSPRSFEDRSSSNRSVPWEGPLLSPQSPSHHFIHPRGGTLADQNDNFHTIATDFVSAVGQDGQPRPQTFHHEGTTWYDGGHVYSPAGTNAGAQALLSMRHRSYPESDKNLPPLSPQTWTSSELSLPPPPPTTTPKELQAPGPLTSPEEATLLRRFSAEVGRWMDLSDLSMTFSKKVCQLALQDPLLKAAGIACAAKQLYLTGQLKDGMVVARKNYDTVISLLIRRLGKSEQPFASYGFAATVMCSCYEMLDATGSDWQKHLEGVFTFGKVRSINGSCGGIEQAGFWSIARQEVVCSIINKATLRLDPELWAVDLENIGGEGSEDLINNQVLTILAKVVNFMAKSESMTSPSDKEAMVGEWEKLRKLLDHWGRSVKGFMDPVSVCQEHDKVFMTIWFARSMCASSWQMFHLAHILLLTTNPRQDRNCMMAFRAIEDDLVYHARQICGIAQSKPHGSCRVNSVQPIYYAGCCLSNTNERKAAAKLLEDIEDELGWAAKYRVRDLHEQWGSLQGG